MASSEFVPSRVMKTNVFCMYLRQPVANQCNLGDWRKPGAPVAMHNRPRHYTAKRGSDAAVFCTQVRVLREVFYFAPELSRDYGVITKQKVRIQP